MEKKPEDIIILQIALGGIAAIMQILQFDKIVRDQDYIGVKTPHGIEDLIYDNQPQLLITGIVSDHTIDVAQLVKTLRVKNPQLVVVTYSSIKFTGPFDRQIDKMTRGAREELVEVITQFRSGKLRRK